ncbi:MAG: UbiA family prenyltransferase [Gammaproteobacteria bacterium]|nr:UbiA family prenyltransferase [Gammaproteobacteria bacterium]
METHDLPLVVDLDGTLTPVDTLLESLVLLLRRRPAAMFRLPFWLASGRAGFKSRVAATLGRSPRHLPWREPLLAYLREQKRMGRPIVLATAAHRSIADAVADELGLFDSVIATDGGVNLKGKAKLDAIRERFGDQFAYAGDSRADLALWRHAAAALPVGRPRRLPDGVHVEREFTQPAASPLVWLRALRVHQWLKNLLLFVPLLTSFGFTDPGKVMAALTGFVAFSLAASATYLVNDLWDLESDRLHPRKRERPMASGRIGISAALGMAAALLATAFLVASRAGSGLALMLLAYLVITSAYSWYLKRMMLVDMLVLAVLYTLRILAGSVAIGVSTSSWLLVFSIFIFFSLALVKRCSELVALNAVSVVDARGRDYHYSDLPVLLPLGVGAGLCAAIVFGLFINAPGAQAAYGTPALLWLTGLGLMYWISRLWIKTVRGEMHDDPLVYTLRDFGCRVTITGMVVATLAAFAVESPFQ